MSATSRRGEMRSGKRSSIGPAGVSRTYGVPASSGGRSTQKPIRFLRNAVRQTPSKRKTSRPLGSPAYSPSQMKTISPRRCSAVKRRRNESAPASRS
jgi:hypothetical protein